MMRSSRLFILMALCASMLLVACNFNPQDATPTAEGIIEEPINPIPDQPEATGITPSATPSPSPTPQLSVQIAT